MNIAIFASAFHPSLGGVEELCRQLALELMRQGHGVIVLTNRWPRDLPATETLDGISVYRLPFRLPEGSAKAAINYHLTHSRVERDMLAILRSHKIDLLHVQCVSSNAHYAMIAQERLNLPLVVTLQGELTMDANQIFQKSRQAQEILRRALDRADVITACSGKTLRDGEEFYGKPFGDRGRVIFNGVNLADFGPSMTNDQRSMSNTTKELGVRSEELEGSDGGGAARLQVTGDRGQGEAAAAAAQNLESRTLHSEGNMDAAPMESAAHPNNSRFEVLGSNFSSRPPYIFALGRVAKQKGFDVLIKAYAALRFNDQRSKNNDQKTGEDGGFTTKTQRHEGPGKNPQISGLAGQPAGRGLAEAGQIESGALPQHSRFEVLDSCSSPSAALPNNLIIDHCSLVIEKDSFPDLILAGDGPELEPLKALARELGLGDSVHFPGRADRRQVASYMAGCEFFVISSPAEPFGIVVLEAMAAGAPVIAVNNAGPAEIITDGVNGLLVDRSEPELFANAMQRLMGDPELRQRLAAGGRARAGEFSWPKIASQYVAAYAAAASMSNEQ